MLVPAVVPRVQAAGQAAPLGTRARARAGARPSALDRCPDLGRVQVTARLRHEAPADGAHSCGAARIAADRRP